MTQSGNTLSADNSRHRRCLSRIRCRLLRIVGPNLDEIFDPLRSGDAARTAAGSPPHAPPRMALVESSRLGLRAQRLRNLSALLRLSAVKLPPAWYSFSMYISLTRSINLWRPPSIGKKPSQSSSPNRAQLHCVKYPVNRKPHYMGAASRRRHRRRTPRRREPPTKPRTPRCRSHRRPTLQQQPFTAAAPGCQRCTPG